MDQHSELTEMAEALDATSSMSESSDLLTSASKLEKLEEKLAKILNEMKPLVNIDRNIKLLNGKFELFEKRSIHKNKQ